MVDLLTKLEDEAEKGAARASLTESWSELQREMKKYYGLCSRRRRSQITVAIAAIEFAAGVRRAWRALK